jgi:polyphenol oxidase
LKSHSTANPASHPVSQITVKMGQMPVSADHQESSYAAIADLDRLLSAAGLAHGRRRLAGKNAKARRQEEKKQSFPVPVKASAEDVEILTVESWTRYSWLINGFSTRIGGVTTAYRTGEIKGELNLGFTASDSPENVHENRRLLIKRLNKGYGKRSLPSLVTLRQIHSSLIHRVGRADSARELSLKGDGMMTDEPGTLLGIQTADCIPVLVADRKRKAVAAFHAGWRGTLKRIVEHGVGRMRLEFGSRPEDLIAAIGPGIGSCCYAVGEEVRHEFVSQFSYADTLFHEVYDPDPIREKYPLLFLTARAPGHSNLGPSLHLDLIEANRRQLLDAGLAEKSIFLTGECTNCLPDRYFSYRASQGFTGRMLSVVGVRK